MQDVHGALSVANVGLPKYKTKDDEQMAQIGQEAFDFWKAT